MVLRTLQLWSLQIFGSLALEVLFGFSKIRSTVLDQTVADLWHYVHPLGGELKAGSPLQGRSEQVLDRLEATWKAAVADGAGPVHLMGHSLGSLSHSPAQAGPAGNSLAHRKHTFSSGEPTVTSRWTAVAGSRRTIALVLAGAAVTALFFYAFVWFTGTFVGWLVGLVWSAAGPAVGHWWKVVMGWWAVVGWFLFTTKDGYNRSRTWHERRWRLRDDPPAN